MLPSSSDLTYFLEIAHLGNLTHAASRLGVSQPSLTLAMQRLLDDHDINVLLYNVQTVTPVTTQIRSLARQHHIPVVGVSETMPAGVATYQQWQQSQLTALLHALESSRNP